MTSQGDDMPGSACVVENRAPEVDNHLSVNIGGCNGEDPNANPLSPSQLLTTHLLRMMNVLEKKCNAPTAHS